MADLKLGSRPDRKAWEPYLVPKESVHPSPDTTSSTIDPDRSSSWVAASACPSGVSIREMIDNLIELDRLLGDQDGIDSDSFNPATYWPEVVDCILRLRATITALQPHLPRCHAWFQIVVDRLQSEIHSWTRFYQFDRAAESGEWHPFPIHQDRHARLKRIMYASAELPRIERWRPVKATKVGPRPHRLDTMLAETVSKVFDDYQYDPDWLTFGTVESLLERCEWLMDRRRDAGEFSTHAPADIRDIRLLADRLGCDEPVLPFEEEDQRAAFGRAVGGTVARAWSVQTDNQVKEWLKRVIAWCESWSPEESAIIEPNDTANSVETTSRITCPLSRLVPQAADDHKPPLGHHAVDTHAVPGTRGDLEHLNRSAAALLPKMVHAPTEDEAGSPQPDHQPARKYKRISRMTNAEANDRAIRLARRDPSFLDASVREWAKQLECSHGLITSLPLWKKNMARRRASAPERSVRAKTLDPRTLDAMSHSEDSVLHQLTREQRSDSKNDTRMALTHERSSRSWAQDP